MQERSISRPPKVSATGAVIHELEKEKLRVYPRDMNINSLNFPYGSEIAKGAGLHKDL